MSDNTVNAALRAMGFSADEVTGHGFRATARTMLQERLGFDPDVIEAQLAHSVRDNLGRAYNRTEFVEQRRKMLQAWADYLDQLRRGADVVPLRKGKREAFTSIERSQDAPAVFNVCSASASRAITTSNSGGAVMNIARICA